MGIMRVRHSSPSTLPCLTALLIPCFCLARLLWSSKLLPRLPSPYGATLAEPHAPADCRRAICKSIYLNLTCTILWSDRLRQPKPRFRQLAATAFRNSGMCYSMPDATWIVS